MADGPRRRRARRARLLSVALLAAACVAAATTWALTRGSGTAYRVAAVEYASVSQSVTSVGTLGSVHQAAVSFPVPGQVATVPVVLGQRVSAGQVLATLGTGSLDQQLAQADQTLAADQQRLAGDQGGQSSAVLAAAGTTAAGTTVTTAGTAPASATAQPLTGSPSTAGAATPGTASGGGLAAAASAVTAAQTRLTADQKALDGVLGEDSLHDLLALTGTAGACAAGPSTTTLTATTDATGTLTITTTTAAGITVGGATLTTPPTQAGGVYTYTFSGTAGTAYPVVITEQTIDPTSCTAAITALVTRLDPDPTGSAWALAQAVGGDELKLDSALGALEQAAAKTSSSTRPATGAATVPASGSATGHSSGGGSAAATITPEQLAADQAAADSAAAQVAVAQQNLAEATITSPIAGTVENIGLDVGSNAAGSTITVIGDGGFEVDTTVSLADLGLVKVGDTATVNADGVPAPLSGTVSAIGMLAAGSGSSTGYPVTVLLDPSSARLFDGAGAAVAIAVASVSHVLTVPSSAIHALGNLRTVTVLTGRTTTTTRVGVGAVGTGRTQITSGLRAGQQVVLADLGAPLPSSTNPLAGLRGTGLGGAGRVRVGFGGGAGGAGGGATTRTGG
ncbi:MAG: HlyD family efflux transporter periplasmic adaptor subunit [Jatrophihabitans sp.]|nr:MAG: HlyD family efflux transporter periplasmic adaptor subunit [Jatrophihabitans sp.]